MDTIGRIRGLNKELIFASSDTLESLEVYGTIINNYGQSADVTLVLPSASEGLSFLVMLGTTVANYFRIDPNANDSIYLNGATTGDGKYIGIASAVTGACLSFISFQTGEGAYDWYASGINGSWVAEA